METPQVITPEQRINALNYQDYLLAVRERLETGAKSIIFDFTSVEFIDTYGVSVLIKSAKMAEKAASFRVRG